MLFNKILLGLLSLSIVLAHPLVERSDHGKAVCVCCLFFFIQPLIHFALQPARASKSPAKSPPKGPAQKGGTSKTPPGMQVYTGTDVEEQDMQANNAPGRKV